jgi:hypothetical protein
LTGAVDVLETIARFGGVRGVERLVDGVRLRVERPASDAVLAEALRLGASVRTVLSPERVI